MSDYKEFEKNVTSYKKYEKKGVDDDSLIAKAPKMGDLVGQVPEKLHLSGPIGETSVKKDTPNANTLHGGDGKTMDATGKKAGY